VIYENK